MFDVKGMLKAVAGVIVVIIVLAFLVGLLF